MRHAFLLALCCHLVLAGGYWLCTPPLEAPLEDVAITAAREHALGIERGDVNTALWAATLRLCGTPDLLPIVAPSEGPGALRLRHAATPGPGHRSVAALRLWSILWGICTLACTVAIARAVFPAHPGVAMTSALMMACMPQFAASHTVLWHGPLLGAATHLALLCAIVQTARGRLQPALAALGALAAGLALHLDSCAWFMVVLSAGVFVAHWRDAVSAALGLGLLALSASLGWSQRGTPVSAASDGRGVAALLHSFVGEAGRAALPVPWPAVAITVLAIAAALPGFVRGAKGAASSPRTFALLTLSCSLGTGACVALAARQGMLGRGLFPALGPMLVLTAAGLGTGPLRRLGARLPIAAWLPIAFLPSLLIVLGQVRPALAPRPDDTRFSEFALDTARVLGAADSQVALPTRECEVAPRLEWPTGTGPAAVTILDRRGRVWFTSDAVGPLKSPWTMPDAAFAALPRGEALIWCVGPLPRDAAPPTPMGTLRRP